MKKILTGTVLSLVGVLTVVVLFSAALVAPVRPADDDSLRRQGFRLTGLRYDRPRFAERRLFFDRIEEHGRADGVRCDVARTVQVPSDSSREADGRLIARLLAVTGLMPERAAFAASDVEFAFAAPDGILRRRSDGRWDNASGGPLPAPFADLNARDRSEATLETRLAHPDALVWTDAAVEACLRGEGARAFADAVLRGGRRDVPVRLLLESGDRDEIARVIAGSNDDGLLQLRLLDELSRPPGVEEVRGRAAALAALSRRRWPASETSAYLRDWLVGCLEDGSFDLLEDRRPAFECIAQACDASIRDRLGRIVRDRDGASCAAAYLILRRLDGAPLEADPDPSLVPEAKRWRR